MRPRAKEFLAAQRTTGLADRVWARRAAPLVLLWLALAVGATPAQAQGSRKDDIVFNARGQPLAGATIRVCSAAATGQPCAPLALIYSDQALTQALVNPTTTDGLGNYSFYAVPGRYLIEISGPGITTKQIPNVILPSDPTAPTFTSVSTTSGISAFSLTLSGSLTVSGSASVTGSLAGGTLAVTNQATPPGAASAGTVNIYSKAADKKVYAKDDTGLETPLGGVGPNVVINNPAAAQNVVAAGNFTPLSVQAAVNGTADRFAVFNSSSVTEFAVGVSGIRKVKGPAPYFDITSPVYGNCVPDNSTDCTPALLAALNAAVANHGGIVYIPTANEASPASEIGYAFSTALTFPATTHPIELWIGGWCILTARWTVTKDYKILGFAPNEGQEGQFPKDTGNARIDCRGASLNPCINIDGQSNIRLERLVIGNGFSNGTSDNIIQVTNGTDIVFKSVHVTLASNDTGGSAVVVRGGFNIYFWECGFLGPNAAAAALVKFVNDPTYGSGLPRQVEVYNTQFTYHAMYMDTTGANIGPNGYDFKDILYENFLDPLLTINSTGTLPINGLSFRHVGMADSATPVALIKTTGGAASVNGVQIVNSSYGGGAAGYFDADVVIHNVFIIDAGAGILAKSGSVTPEYVRFVTPTNGQSAFEIGNKTSVIGSNSIYWPMAVPSGLSGTAVSGGTLVNGTTYVWIVTAVDASGGETTISNQFSTTMTSPNLSESLTWTAVPGAAKYRVYRTVSPYGSNSVFGGVNAGAEPTTNAYTDTGFGGNPTSVPAYNTAAAVRLNSGGITLGSETTSAAPRGIFAPFLPGALTTTWTAATWTLDKAITVTRMQVQVKTAPAGCTTNAVVRLTDGTTPVSVTITAAATDSGAITQNYAAAAVLTLTVQTAAAGCTTSPQDANVIVQYRMQ